MQLEKQLDISVTLAGIAGTSLRLAQSRKQPFMFSTPSDIAGTCVRLVHFLKHWLISLTLADIDAGASVRLAQFSKH